MLIHWHSKKDSGGEKFVFKSHWDQWDITYCGPSILPWINWDLSKTNIFALETQLCLAELVQINYINKSSFIIINYLYVNKLRICRSVHLSLKNHRSYLLPKAGVTYLQWDARYSASTHWDSLAWPKMGRLQVPAAKWNLQIHRPSMSLSTYRLV